MSAMSKRPEPTPEGALIAKAQRLTPHSQREAADLAGISENHWRAVTKGFRTVSAGVYAAVRDVPANTIARMARVVGVTAEQLIEAGRADAAEELGALPPAEQAGSAPTVEERVAALTEQVYALRAELDALKGEEHRRDETG